MKTLAILLAASTMLTLQNRSLGQAYTISWFTVDGGAGASSGSSVYGAFTLAGTIGQADAGPTFAGGEFSLTGGFWSFLSNTNIDSSQPTLRIRLVGRSVVISWPNPSSGFELQETTALLGTMTSWSNVNQIPNVVGQDRQVAVPGTFNSRFYRLKKP